jgi:hypothetical protein
VTGSTIDNRHDLIEYLHRAMVLEHATIPPYLTAYYSIHPTTNSDAAHIIRVVAVEEMLHLTLAANVLNAIGGKPRLTRHGFVPSYPTYLPDGERDFTVDLRPFSHRAVETFCKIERPAMAPRGSARLLPVSDRERPSLVTSPVDEGLRFYSIGEFYAEIIEGIETVAAKEPDLFRGDPARQVGPEHFYSGGGSAIRVTDLASARRALHFIADQGEGFDHGIHDEDGELAHYYRFRQLQLGRYYQVDDDPEHPTGPELGIDWKAVYDVKVSARLSDYPVDSELAAVARDFNADYWEFLGLLDDAFNGEPSLLQEAIWHMFRLRDGINRLVRNPLPGSDGLHAAPTFEMPVGVESTPDVSLTAGGAVEAVTR